jgi:hypothetical protein
VSLTELGLIDSPKSFAIMSLRNAKNSTNTTHLVSPALPSVDATMVVRLKLVPSGQKEVHSIERRKYVNGFRNMICILMALSCVSEDMGLIKVFDPRTKVEPSVTAASQTVEHPCSRSRVGSLRGEPC